MIRQWEGLYQWYRRILVFRSRTTDEISWRESREFPLGLKELESGYTRRHHDLYDDLVKCISGYSRVASIQQSPGLWI